MRMAASALGDVHFSFIPCVCSYNATLSAAPHGAAFFLGGGFMLARAAVHPRHDRPAPKTAHMLEVDAPDDRVV